MRLFRVVVDSVFFVLPYFAPLPILTLYLLIHLFYGSLVHLPRRLDDIDHRWNIVCRDDIVRRVLRRPAAG